MNVAVCHSIVNKLIVYVCNDFFIGLSYYTVYGKTFEGGNFHGFHGFHGFLANCESFPLESLAVYST